MDVKDYSQKLDQVRDQYRKVAEDLRSSYDKDTDNIKENSDYKINKLSKAYEDHKTKLDEQNLINNENYSNKTKQAIADKTERFRNELKNNTNRFEGDRTQLKNQFQVKLSDLSNSYKKSTEENNRFHDQAMKTMSDRYNKNNSDYKNEFNSQIEKYDKKNRKDFAKLKDEMHTERLAQENENQENLEQLRADSAEAKFRDVSRLRNDNENLRTKFDQERQTMNDQQEGRINDILNVTKAEREEGQRTFNSLQDNIRRRTVASDEKMKSDHLNESKALAKRFNEDLRNVQHMTNQKIKGGSAVTQLQDENKLLAKSYENRLNLVREDLKKLADDYTEKEHKIDDDYRDKMKNLKVANNEALENREQDLNAQNSRAVSDFKDKSNSLNERYKSELSKSKLESEAKLTKADTNSKQELKKQRVEFGNYINTVNDKKMEEISSIKMDFSKNKTNFIEKTRRDVSEDKQLLKEGFHQQLAAKDEIFERKLGEMEKQTQKIIENYELRMNQLARKSEKEIEVMKSLEEARKIKENQAAQFAIDSVQRDHEIEVSNLRNKYEGMIGKDRALNESRTTQIIQKYEDQIERERTFHQKELSLKLSEAQVQNERLFKQNELEKETLRNQFEQRIENMKNSTFKQGNSKKA